LLPPLKETYCDARAKLVPLACLWGNTGLAGGGRSATVAPPPDTAIGKAPTGGSKVMTGRVLADAETLAMCPDRRKERGTID
jgi:hypothetical protein